MRPWLLLLLLATSAAAQPLTAYESAPPEGYDLATNTFTAQALWQDDRLVQCLPFHTYDLSDRPAVPVAPLYVPTTGGFAGAMDPVLQYHMADAAYSDFVEVVFVTVNGTQPHSYGELAALPMDSTGIVLNMPIVPAGSSLTASGGPLGIEPVMVWYEGARVQTFVLEAGDQTAIDHFGQGTRLVPLGPHLTARPVWLLSQYGGHDILAGDAYTPLQRYHWVTAVPPDYQADEASAPEQLEGAFVVEAGSTYRNCPVVGPAGPLNDAKAEDFDGEVDSATVLQGTIPHGGGRLVTLKGLDATRTTLTEPDGTWSFTVPARDLAYGDNDVYVHDDGDNLLVQYTLHRDQPKGTAAVFWIVVVGATAGVGYAYFLRRRI